ncbi:MAG TPA: S8 family serine peptidase [Flavobacterium sp.]|nr:S8 family serine peptidase [Flavobacterium sp.]
MENNFVVLGIDKNAMGKFLLFFFMLAGFYGHSQEDAWVYFNAKANAQTYLDNPLTMLSQRALDRRTNQNIPLDFKDVPINQVCVDAVDAAEDIVVKAKSKWLNAVHVRGTVDAINLLAALSFVDHVDFADNSLDVSGKNTVHKQPHPVNKTMETLVDFPYGNSANQIQMLNGHLLHQQNYTGSGKIIAVLDAGFPEVDVVQPFARLRDNNQILGGYNFVDRNDDYYSRYSHGTMVLSTMGGYTENQLVGTAPDASYYLFITEDIDSENPVEESLWVEAAETADSLGVDVINSSLGYFEYDNPAYSYTYADMNGTTAFASRGADIAFSRGMVVVVSAGNSGATANPHIGVPGDAINALTVGAVKADESYASFSSIGPSADGRVKPDVMAQGQSAVLSDTFGDITTNSGTSFSGPIMAGMVASFWQAVPTLTNVQVVQFIKQSADLFANPTTQKGYGIPDFQLALTAALLSVSQNTSTNFVLWPNPVQDKLFIAGLSEAAEMRLYNSLGQCISVQQIAIGDNTAHFGNLESGVYFYKIVSGNKTQSGKLIKS